VRTRRVAQDRVDGLDKGFRRYRCTGPACGWQGLVALAQVAPRPLRRQRHRRGLLLKAAAWLLAALGLAASASWWAWRADTTRPAGPGAHTPAGESYDGDPLPARLQPAASAMPAAFSAEAPNASPALRLRQGCAWGKPGRNPYQGTVTQALQAAHLPAELVAPLAARIQARQADDRVEISTAAIRAVNSRREYNPRGFAMSFGHTMCLNSRVNFAPGHTEAADLYEVADATGRTLAVMVPDVCGNVSVLGARGQRGPLQRLLARPMALLSESFAGADLADGDGGYFDYAVAGGEASHAVPEPGGLASVVTALLAAWAALRRRRRSAGA
jgi:hypothetical protein